MGEHHGGIAEHVHQRGDLLEMLRGFEHPALSGWALMGEHLEDPLEVLVVGGLIVLFVVRPPRGHHRHAVEQHGGEVDAQ